MHVSRQHLVYQHVGRLNADPNHTRQQAHHGVWSIIGRLLKMLQACLLDLPNLTSAWAAPSVHSERWMQYPRRRPIASSIMGFGDEVEQSFGRPCRQTNGRSKRTCELTSSIVPRGTSFHRSVELESLLD